MMNMGKTGLLVFLKTGRVILQKGASHIVGMGLLKAGKSVRLDKIPAKKMKFVTGASADQ